MSHGSIRIAEEVREARAVVALETTLVAHGFPPGEGVEVGLESERQVRAAGAVPATIGVLDGEVLVGFFNFVPEGHEVRLGLGMRPDLTGRGLAQPFIEAGLEYARAQWEPLRFRLWVARWNERALRAYRRAGFREARPEEQSRFVEMERPA